MLNLIGKYTPSRVQAAVFSLLWNRWTTARRFQKRDKRCLLCDRQDTEDSIEHYSRCKVTREILSRFLRLDETRFATLHTFVLVNPDIDSKECLVKIALLTYGIYRTTNAVRGRSNVGANFFEAIKQAIKDGANGHQEASRILDGSWSTAATCTPVPACPLIHFGKPVMRWRSLVNTQSAKKRRTDANPSS